MISILDRNELISEGSYGRVYKTHDPVSGKNLAVKERKFTEVEKEYGIPSDILREIVLLKKLNNENVIKPLRVEIDNKAFTYWMYLEYFDYDLFGFINASNQNKTEIPFDRIKSIIYQILKGVEYIHSRLIVHRDLKPSNILLNTEFKVMITDFGFARQLAIPLRTVCKRVGTLGYRAPEMLINENFEYGTSVDIWAVGCIMINLLTKETFVNEPDEQATLKKLISILGKEKFACHDMYKKYIEKGQKIKKDDNSFKINNLKTLIDEEGYQLLQRLMEPHPLNRIEAVEALRHPWFKELNNN